MVPLSCLNCCHNPLQLGPVGTAYGYCTRHRVVLTRPELTTCGQQLRKDLLAESARRQRELHARAYPADDIVLVDAPNEAAARLRFIEKANGHLPADAVMDEVQDYGQLDSKISSMAALRRIPGARAEVARLSLSRAYFSNCVAHGGKWTAGVHLLHWTLERLDEDPRIEATELRGPIAYSVAHTVALARWAVLAFRLAFVSDVGRVAATTDDPAGRLATLAGKAVGAGPGGDADRLLEWIRAKRRTWSSALAPARYGELREQLHREDENQA